MSNMASLSEDKSNGDDKLARMSSRGVDGTEIVNNVHYQHYSSTRILFS